MALRLLLLSLALGASGCFGRPVVGDPCTEDEDCDRLKRNAVCYPGIAGSFCTLLCDIEEIACLEVVGTVCVRRETRYRIATFGEMDCNNVGGTCMLVGPRTVCVPE